MFNLAGDAKITMQGANGETYKMDGFVESVDMECGMDGSIVSTVRLVGSHPVTLKGDFMPDPPPTPAADKWMSNVREWAASHPQQSRRPWSWESIMLAVAGAFWVAGWVVAIRAIWRWWL